MKSNENRVKWFYYTVLVGFIPIILRVIIVLVLNDKNAISMVNVSDFILFGLVLNITNINEIENIKYYPKIHRIRVSGISVIFIIILSLLFSLSVVNEASSIFSNRSILFSAIILSVATFICSGINFFIQKIGGK